MKHRTIICLAVIIALEFCVSAQGSAQISAATEPGDPAAGDDVFIKCSGCHQIGPGSSNGIGPQLNGVVGRLSGSVAGYDYSPALAKAKITWTHDSLAAFVTDAGHLVPGTKMSFAGLKAAQDVEDLIAYVSRFEADGRAR